MTFGQFKNMLTNIGRVQKEDMSSCVASCNRASFRIMTSRYTGSMLAYLPLFVFLPLRSAAVDSVSVYNNIAGSLLHLRVGFGTKKMYFSHPRPFISVFECAAYVCLHTGFTLRVWHIVCGVSAACSSWTLLSTVLSKVSHPVKACRYCKPPKSFLWFSTLEAERCYDGEKAAIKGTI